MKLKKPTFKHIEAELYGFHETKRAIEKRRQEIMYHQKEDDENTGGGSNSVRIPGRPTERIATMLVMDKQLRNLEEIAEAIETVYDKATDEHKKLIKIKYWDKRNLSWEHIADELHVNRATAIRWRNGIVIAVSQALGWR